VYIERDTCIALTTLSNPFIRFLYGVGQSILTGQRARRPRAGSNRNFIFEYILWGPPSPLFSGYR
jgi:hypothetical protein